MVRFYIRGLTINLVEQGRLRSLMVTSHMPPHLPSLFVLKDKLEHSTVDPINDIKGRWRGAIGREDKMYGWDLTSSKLDVANNTDELMLNDPPVSSEYPSPEFPDWSPLVWIPDVARLLPNATLKQSYRDCGDTVSTVVRFAGGVLSGGAPDGLGGDYVWYMRPSLVQALTDTLIVECVPPDFDVLRIGVADCNGTPRGYIDIRDGADVWIINEPEAKNAEPSTDPPTMPHIQHFIDAFDDPDGAGAKVKPYALYNYQRGEDGPLDNDRLGQIPARTPASLQSSREFDVGYCIGGLVIESLQATTTGKAVKGPDRGEPSHRS